MFQSRWGVLIGAFELLASETGAGTPSYHCGAFSFGFRYSPKN